MKRRERRRCPHIHVRGIHGDEINHTPGGRRLECLDCGQLLDGPVLIAMIRAGEAELVDAKCAAATNALKGEQEK